MQCDMHLYLIEILILTLILDRKKGTMLYNCNFILFSYHQIKLCVCSCQLLVFLKTLECLTIFLMNVIN